MINFKEEIQKYQPVLEVDDVEESVYSEEIKDLMDILQELRNKIDQKE